MPTVTVTNTDANLSAKTLVVAENAQTVTGLQTFSRSPNPPFAVTAGSTKVANLDADKADGFDFDQSVLTTANVVFNSVRFTANQVTPGSGSLYKTATGGLNIQGVVGTIDDFAILNPAATVAIVAVPTGTVNLELAGVVRTPGGSAATPTYSFVGDTASGIYLNGVSILGLTTGGVDNMLFDGNGAYFAKNLRIANNINSPAQITADQNNYAPASFTATTLLRLGSDAARAVTGLAGGAQGRAILISNQGAFTITLSHESVLSTAGNRFTCPGAVAYSLTTGKTAWVVYDNTSSRWLVTGS